MSDIEKKSANRTGIQSIDRAMSIIDYIAENNGKYGLSELARNIGLSKATAYGLLSTLEKHRVVFLSPDTKRYRLGIHLAELGSRVENNIDVRREAKPYMNELAGKYRCSVQLGIESNDEVLYIAVCVSPQFSLPNSCQIGSSLPCYCSGVGKAIMAFWPFKRQEEYLNTKELTPRTIHTVSSPVALRSELDVARNLGYIVENEEHQLGVVSFAAPIFDISGAVTAAISVGLLTTDVTPEIKNALIRDLKRITREISQKIGFCN